MKVNDEYITDHYSCEDLPKLLTTIQDNEFTILCSAPDSSSTVGAFPLFDTSRIFSKIPKDVVENPPEVISRNSTLISRRLKRLEHRSPLCMLYQEDIEALSQQEAVLLLADLSRKHKITGAMHFQKDSLILFQCECENFILRYGKKTTLNEMPPLVLDIDDGFILTTEATTGVDADDKIVHRELQKHFKKWKADDYRDELISAEHSGFYGKENVTIHHN
jgi:hypothetical protein